MAASPARVAALHILLRIERQAAFASELLHSRHTQALSIADRAFTTELVMGVERWRSCLDAIIAQHSSIKLEKLDLEVLLALRLGSYQLRWLNVPARAAIHESVELVKLERKRSATGLVNAVLRKVNAELADAAQHRTQHTFDSPEIIADQFAHPTWLVQRWWQQYGPERTLQICRYDQSVPPTTVRLRIPAAENDLQEQGVVLAPAALVTGARQVSSGNLIASNALREGKVFIQDEASQLVGLLVGHGESILDCCAAPGSKTTILADRNPAAQIVAADFHPHRVRLLRRLVTMQNVSVIAADATKLPLIAGFGRILADVPCSGTGTLARNPEIKWRLKASDLSHLHARQLAILRSALNHLSAGGRLIYSTCSLEPEENQLVVAEALNDSQQFRFVPCLPELQKLKTEGELAWPDFNSLTDGPFLRTIPGIHPGDGFFAAIIEPCS